MDTPEIRAVTKLRAEGWTTAELRRAVARGDLERLRRGAYAAPGDLDDRARHARRTLAVCTGRSPDHVVSHSSAAVLHGLPVRPGALGVVHLTRWGPTHGKVADGVRLHRSPLSADEAVEVHGLRVCSLERTLADLVRGEPFEWGVAAADAALRLGADAALLVEYADAGRRRSGNARLREVLAFADGRAESAAESMSRVSMARAGIPRPELQFDVHLPEGGWVATSDFGWPDLGVVGEMDGKQKYTADPRRGRSAGDVVMAEKERDALITECGYTPAHWGWAMATDHVRLGHYLRALFAGRRRTA